MDLPVIMAIDDDLAALAILDRELRKRYEDDYRVVTKQSANAALEYLAHIHKAGERIALVLADQWMPEMEGNVLLGRVRIIDPLAKRVMLINWGDTRSPEAIYHSCAYGLIEHFTTKPWHAGTDERFHREVAEQLYQWARLNQRVFEAVKLVDEEWSPRAHELRDLLGRNGVPYGFYAVGSQDGDELLRESGLDKSARLPVAAIFGGKVLEDPSNRELTEAIGVKSRPTEGDSDVVIIGGGPAGLATAVYASSEGLFTTILEREAIGGQAGRSSLILNYLGFPNGISGEELAARAYEQAWEFGARFLFSNGASDIRLEGDEHVVTLADGGELLAKAVVVASGVSYRRLGIPALDALIGAGVYYGAVSTEARTLEGGDVIILGGGNSAGQAALHMSKYAHKVTLVTRGASLDDTMSHYLTTMLEGAANVWLLPRSEIVDGEGQARLETITIQDLDTGERQTTTADGLFVMVGAEPHTGWLPASILRDQDGFILTGSDLPASGPTDGHEALFPSGRGPYPLETSMPGVFAVGDVRNGSAKRVSAAVGDGATAVRSCHQYLADLRTRAAA
jgi:thioredoxin reductase (NADPH)